MRHPVLSLIAAACAGIAVTAVAFALWSPRVAQAQGTQFKGGSTFGGLPIGGLGNTGPAGANQAAGGQPLAIQGLTPETFVVASRETRLMQKIGATDNAAQQMLVTVVTHYTYRGDRLIPVEHVKAPTGYRAVTIEE